MRHSERVKNDPKFLRDPEQWRPTQARMIRRGLERLREQARLCDPDDERGRARIRRSVEAVEQAVTRYDSTQ